MYSQGTTRRAQFPARLRSRGLPRKPRADLPASSRTADRQILQIPEDSSDRAFKISGTHEQQPPPPSALVHLLVARLSTNPRLSHNDDTFPSTAPLARELAILGATARVRADRGARNRNQTPARVGDSPACVAAGLARCLASLRRSLAACRPVAGSLLPRLRSLDDLSGEFSSGEQRPARKRSLDGGSRGKLPYCTRMGSLGAVPRMRGSRILPPFLDPLPRSLRQRVVPARYSLAFSLSFFSFFS